MNFLLSGCNNPDILRVIFLAKKILNIVFLIVPIALIVMITIDIFKMITGASEEKTIKNNTKTIINRIIFAILLFFVPTIVSFIINVLSNAGIAVYIDNGTGEKVTYQQCLDNATKETIKKKQTLQDEEERKAEEKRKQ